MSFGERCFDLVLLALVTPVIVLVGLATAVAIYLDSPGPVIFRSHRVGRDGRLFVMFKFRKMRMGSEGHLLTVADDERFTPIGRLLAATRLDELPQAWNVLRGDMRLVGPRPELEYFVTQFSEQYADILAVTPGITGVAQLRFRDEKSMFHGDHPATAYLDRLLPAKIVIDLDYVRSRSLAGDLKILARTVALPLAVLVSSARRRSWMLRAWLPAAGLAGVLLLAFALSSSSVS